MPGGEPGFSLHNFILFFEEQLSGEPVDAAASGWRENLKIHLKQNKTRGGIELGGKNFVWEHS